MFELEEPNYKLNDVKFSVDGVLNPKIKSPFPNKSFLMLINGRPGSGKTSLLINMLSKKDIYKKVFDKILLVMPKSSTQSLENNIFADIPEDQYFDKLSYDVITKINEFRKSFDGISKPENPLLGSMESPTPKQKNKKILLILDDVGSTLKDNEDMLKELAQNRRHLKLSIIILSQMMRDVPRSLRLIATDVITFKSNNNIENQILREEFVNLPAKEFRRLINFVYSESHSFMFINKETETFYKNLSKINNI